MRDGVVRQYVVEADRQENHGAEQFGRMEDEGLAARTFAKAWRRGMRRQSPSRPFEEFAFVTDAWGKRRSLSQLQVRVLRWLEARPDGARFTQRLVADSLGVNVSSISRTLALLEAFGLAHTDRRPGRYGGTRKVSIPPERLKARAKLAWRRIIRARDMRTWRNIKWMLQSHMPAWVMAAYWKATRRPRRLYT